MSQSTVRSVLSRILKGSALTQQARVKVAEADSYIDGALWVLSSEEPTLLEWLHTDAELAQSFKATLTAVYYSIEEGICQSGQLETSVLRTKALMFSPLQMVRQGYKYSLILRQTFVSLIFGCRKWTVSNCWNGWNGCVITDVRMLSGTGASSELCESSYR